jgi:hypothetical protein
MKDIVQGLDGDEVTVIRFEESPEAKRSRARARQDREALASTAFVMVMFLIAMLPLLWAGVR